MSDNNIFAAIASALGACSIIIGFIFLFVDIKKKVKISLKSGIKVVGCICFGVLIITLSYHFGLEAASEEVSQDTNATDASVVEHGNIVSTDIGDIIIEGNNNDININNETNNDGQSNLIPLVTVQRVTLNYTLLDIIVGDTASLLATVTYSDNTTDNSVIWTSSNPFVAEVDSDGNITAMSVGTTTITAQASKNNDAKDESCTVTVVNPPSEPTGYSIRLSTDQAIINETFKVYVTPYEEDITGIQIYTISPSGLLDNFPLSDDGKYCVYTETGIWTIYASVENEAGVYMAQKAEDFVTIEILSAMDAITNMLQ